MKKKQLSPEQADLSVIIGNNADKIKAIHILSESQIIEVLKDLFSRPAQLDFSDCEGMTKAPLNTRFPITGEMVVKRIIDAGKFPKSMTLTMAQYLKDTNKFGTSVGEKFLQQQIQKCPQSCELVISEWATKLTFGNRKFMPVPIFMNNKGLILNYQHHYYKTIKEHATNLDSLSWLVESFLALLHSSDQELVNPNLKKVVSEIVSFWPASEVKKIKPINYIDPNIPSDQDLANQLVYQAIMDFKKR